VSEASENHQASVEVDVVVVAYRSGDTLRGCVEPLSAMPHVNVVVVDNACPDDSTRTVADLPVEIVRSPRNGGFSYGCNLGAARGTAPYLLFLNPDARLDAAALAALVAVLRDDPGTALVAPRILDDDGSLSWSLRRFPRLRSTYAQALFLHRVFPLAPWTDELIRDPSAYAQPARPEWVSGACMLVRRSVFTAIGGWDERFFLYCEDTDLCQRIWDAGSAVRFEPRAEVQHVGGASSGAGETQAIAARSRVLYARKHRRRAAAWLEAFGVALSEATHVLSSVTRPASRRGHAKALRAALGRR
jgi:N-acetylglucosaminyl-diphospho-decaprenol L-rhamnosyltransferase